MQLRKENGKNPPDQTNEEELGSLPEKAFRVMIVKMIPNRGNEMEAQINQMGPWIEKTQEIFNKDLEEINDNQQHNWNKKICKEEGIME